MISRDEFQTKYPHLWDKVTTNGAHAYSIEAYQTAAVAELKLPASPQMVEAFAALGRMVSAEVVRDLWTVEVVSQYDALKVQKTRTAENLGAEERALAVENQPSVNRMSKLGQDLLDSSPVGTTG